METREEIRDNMLKEFAKDQFPECAEAGDVALDEWSEVTGDGCNLVGWSFRPECICTECHMG